jgi:hypothetical protein
LISIQNEIQITQSIIYFIAAAIPIYLTCIWKKRNGNHFKRLTIVLASFVLMQGFYHGVGALGFSFISKGVLEPLSFGILLFFGSMYIISKTRAKNEQKVKVQ